MKKFLIIDDDEVKVNEFIKSVKSLEGYEDSEFTWRKGRNSGLRELLLDKNNNYIRDEAREYDILVLDLNFPLYDDDINIERDMGLEVLSEIKRKKFTIPVLIYSSEPRQLEEHYSHIKGYVDSNYYLKSQLELLLNSIQWRVKW